jgi:hypothetical protein
MNFRHTIVGMLLMTSTSGCLYAIRDEIDETHRQFNNHMMAGSAYRDYQATRHGHIPCPHSFKEGFEAGYIDVLNGKPGCPPLMVPPNCHSHAWLDHCSPEEQRCAWYNGYSAGVGFAHGDGVVGINTLPLRAPVAVPAGVAGSPPGAPGYVPGPGPLVPQMDGQTPVEMTPFPEVVPSPAIPAPYPQPLPQQAPAPVPAPVPTAFEFN